MANFNDTYSIIVGAADFSTGHTYNAIYGGSAGCTIVINGVSVDIGPSSKINMNIQTITGGAGCYLLGENKNVGTGSLLL